MKIALSIKRNKAGDNLSSLLVFLEFMRKGEFDRDLAERFTRKSTKERFLKIAKSIILNEIYGVNVESDASRTGSIYNSIRVDGHAPPVTGFSNAGHLIVYSDPRIAPAISGKDKGSYSYLGFFENPNIGEGSFIQPKGTLAPSRYRPFLSVMTNELKEEATTTVNELSKAAILKRIPRKLT
jgi:hypothetical protein